MKVTTIDDNPDHAFYFQHLMKQIPSLSVESTYHRSIDEFRAHSTTRPDLVCLDLGLDETQGLDTLASFNAQFPSIPVVVLTSNDDTDLAVQAIRQGAQDYLFKSDINSATIERSIRYSVERWRLKLERQEHIETLATFNKLVAHDLRAPLAMLLLYLEEIASLGIEFPLQADKQAIQITTRMSDLVVSLCRYTSISESSSVLDLKYLSLLDAIEAAKENIKQNLTSSGATIEASVSSKIFAIDLSLMTLVFQNLFLNSIKYSDKSAIHVSLEDKSDDNFMLLIVEDNGPGIPEHLYEAIFEPLNRGLHNGDTTIEGAGLGLTTCRRIIQAHGDTISVENCSSGARFIIRMPQALI